MKSSTKIILLSAGIAGLAATIYMLFIKEDTKPKPKDTEKKDTKTGEVEKQPSPDVGSSYTAPPASSFPLSKGSAGADVMAWQKLLLLKDAEYKKVELKYQTDGDFGSRTEQATVRVLGKPTVSKADFDKVAKEVGEADTIAAEQSKINAIWDAAKAKYPVGKYFVLKNDKSFEYTFPNINSDDSGIDYKGTNSKHNGGTAFGIKGIWIDSKDMKTYIVAYANSEILLIPSENGYVKS